MKGRFCRIIENDAGAQFLIEMQMIEGSRSFQLRQVFMCEDVTVDLAAGPMTEERARTLMEGLDVEAIKKTLDNPQAAVDALMSKTKWDASDKQQIKTIGPDNPQLN